MIIYGTFTIPINPAKCSKVEHVGINQGMKSRTRMPRKFRLKIFKEVDAKTSTSIMSQKNSRQIFAPQLKSVRFG